jgi:hypothetical protein
VPVQYLQVNLAFRRTREALLDTYGMRDVLREGHEVLRELLLRSRAEDRPQVPQQETHILRRRVGRCKYFSASLAAITVHETSSPCLLYR